jgi:hypothetical protein
MERPNKSIFGLIEMEGRDLRELLWPLMRLTARERAIFTEYHYWKTHMRVIAANHKISIGRAYEILYRSEEKVANARSQEEETGTCLKH